MDIYYRENTGLKTAQNENCDYFTINLIGADLPNNTAFAEIHFWITDQHAVDGLPARLSRTVEFPIETNRSIDDGIAVVEFNRLYNYCIG